MPRNEKARQKALQRNSAKRKQKQRSVAAIQVGPRGALAVIRSAARWPLEECLISEHWQREGEIVQAVVARRSPKGEIAAAVFLIDLGSLGVKSAFVTVLPSQTDYERELLQGLSESQPIVSADLNLVAKVVREAVAYARGLGFSPNRDYPDAELFLEGADPDAVDVEVPLGIGGFSQGRGFGPSGLARSARIRTLPHDITASRAIQRVCWGRPLTGHLTGFRKPVRSLGQPTRLSHLRLHLPWPLASSL